MRASYSLVMRNSGPELELFGLESDDALLFSLILCSQVLYLLLQVLFHDRTEFIFELSHLLLILLVLPLQDTNAFTQGVLFSGMQFLIGNK